MRVSSSGSFQISFPQLVVGVGFVIVDLADEGGVPVPYAIQFLRGSTVVDTFNIPVVPSSNSTNQDVCYLGYINADGFDKIMFPRLIENFYVDQVNAFKRTELRLI
jgi:hypothetical protein